MPRYYFDVQDNTGRLEDDLGEELIDDAAAAHEAIKVATSIARESISSSGSLVVKIRKMDRHLLTVTLTIAIDLASR